MHIHTLTYIYTLTYTHIYTHYHTCTHTYIHTYIHSYLHKRTYTLTYIHTYTPAYIPPIRGGARGVMVMVIGNKHSDLSSNLGRSYLHFYIVLILSGKVRIQQFPH